MTARHVARPVLTALSLALTALGLAATPSSAQSGGAGGGLPTITFAGGFVYHSVEIPAGATVAFRVTCPPPTTAVGATVSSGDPRVLTLLSLKDGGTAWSFGFRNTDPQNPVTIVVVVTCMSPKGGVGWVPVVRPKKTGPGPGIIYVKPSKKTKWTFVPPGSTQTLSDPCPKGDTPIGDSVKTGESATPKSARPASVGNGGGAQVTSVTMGRRGMSIGVRNPSQTAIVAAVGSDCLPRTFRLHGRERSIQVNRRSFPETVGNHGSVVSAGCPGEMPVWAGFSLPPIRQLGFIGAGFRTGPLGASWAFSNFSGQPQQVTVNLACVPGKATFVDGLNGAQGVNTAVGPIQISD